MANYFFSICVPEKSQELFTASTSIELLSRLHTRGIHNRHALRFKTVVQLHDRGS
jgi:hypothetical protein